MRRAARVDANQPDIVAALRKIGAEVTYLHQLGGGVSDLLVSFRQRWFVIECKTDDGDLTQDQREWIGKQKAPVYLVTDAMQAVGFLQTQMPDWLLGLEAKTMRMRSHVCEGPPPGEDAPLGDEVRQPRELLVERVHEALRNAWRSRKKLAAGELCEMLNSSKSSKRVEKALRELCRQGLVQREGNNRNALYWSTTGAST